MKRRATSRKGPRLRIRLIHAIPGEATPRVVGLEAAGYRVAFDPLTPAVMKTMRASPPDVFVVDLERGPTMGRDFAVWARGVKPLRNVPLVFAGGAPATVDAARRLLPDATFATWRGIGPAIRRAHASPPSAPVDPGSPMAGYSGTPLPKKLGIKEGTVVGLLGAPAGFLGTLGALPAGCSIRSRPSSPCDLIIWFTRRRKDLAGIRKAADLARSGLWIAWPKQASGVKTDITQHDVRRTGLANDLVDYKIAAIDATWSGLKFAHRPYRSKG